MKILLGCTAMALILASCGGGGGSSSSGDSSAKPLPILTDDNNTPKTDPDTDDREPETPEEPETPLTKARSQDGGPLDFSLNDIGNYVSLDTVSFVTPDEGVVATLESESALSNRVRLKVGDRYIAPDDWDYSYVTSVGGYHLGGANLTYLDEHGQPVTLSGYFISDDFKTILAPRDQASNHQYTGVSYEYSVSKTGELAPINVSQDDGQITYAADSGVWFGNFGDVQLTGTLNGQEVAGTAQLDDMKGKFSGIDAYANYIVEDYWGFNDVEYSENVTAGGFSGDNGDNSAFAGSWGHLEDASVDK